MIKSLSYRSIIYNTWKLGKKETHAIFRDLYFSSGNKNSKNLFALIDNWVKRDRFIYIYWLVTNIAFSLWFLAVGGYFFDKTRIILTDLLLTYLHNKN
jgi:hypothetical protein